MDRSKFCMEWQKGWKFICTDIIFHLMHGVCITAPFYIIMVLGKWDGVVKIILYVLLGILYLVVLPLFGHFILELFYPEIGEDKKFLKIVSE